MVSEAGPTTRKLMLPLLAVHPEVAKSFLFGLTGQFTAPAEADFNGQGVVFVHFAPAAGNEAALRSSLAIADGLVVLLRHLDAASLETARARLAELSASNLPRVFVVARAAVEHELKIGCPACAQKLRVEHAEAGRTARCPRCEFTFRIPRAEALLRSGLTLAAEVPVSAAILGQPESCRAAVQPLLELLRRARPASGAGAPAADPPASAARQLCPLP
jgi:hypothetical protein